ncbi:hypothetical protein D3C76_870860 [compost metagenome]
MLQQAFDQAARIGGRAVAMAGNQCFAEPDCCLQVFALASQDLAAEFNDAAPIGGFQFGLPFPLRQARVIRAALFADAVVDLGKTHVFAARRRFAQGLQQRGDVDGHGSLTPG